MTELIGGKEMTPDLHRVTIKEWRSIFEKDQPQEQEDAIIAKIAGISVDELLELSQPDYKLLVRAIFNQAKEPLADPS
jgi:formate-dependent phosphoribosylglycinamide formyltransferase (GAR transformylase)